MKKLMVAAAIIAAGSTFAVESANIVGYNTVQYKAGKWLIAATPFQNVTGGNIDLQDLVTGFGSTDVAFVNAATARTTAPYIQIQARDGSGNVTGATVDYFYVNNAVVSSTFVPGKGVQNVTQPGWCDTSGNLVGGTKAAAVSVAPGTAFWFKDPLSDADITLAGQVVSANAETVSPTAGKWNLVCNPFPMEIDLNSEKITWTGISDVAFVNAATARTTAPYIQIQIRDSSGDVTGATADYFYVNNAIVSSTFVPGKGVQNVTQAGWCDESGNLVGGSKAAAVAIRAGTGFWFKDPSSSVTIQFTK